MAYTRTIDSTLAITGELALYGTVSWTLTVTGQTFASTNTYAIMFAKHACDAVAGNETGTGGDDTTVSGTLDLATDELEALYTKNTKSILGKLAIWDKTNSRLLFEHDVAIAWAPKPDDLVTTAVGVTAATATDITNAIAAASIGDLSNVTDGATAGQVLVKQADGSWAPGAAGTGDMAEADYVSGGAVKVAKGGTGATSAGAALTSLGTLATADINARSHQPAWYDASGDIAANAYAVPYDVAKQAQSLGTISDTLTLTKGTGWPSAGTYAQVVIDLTLSGTPSITWTIADAWVGGSAPSDDGRYHVRFEQDIDGNIVGSYGEVS